MRNSHAGGGELCLAGCADGRRRGVSRAGLPLDGCFAVRRQVLVGTAEVSVAEESVVG